MDSKHLLVPIKVQALVIDDIVIQKSGVVEFERRYVANDGRWSPQLYDYQPLLGSLRGPGPRPFYGASRKYGGRDTEQLVLDPNTNKEALPQNKDRGVYLHWVLPAGLRHAYTPGLLDFPVLPDQWLVVRFAREGSTLKTRAWFIDGGAFNESSPTNLLFPGSDRYVSKRVGKVVPLDDFATADFSAERTTITAIGNASTGSPTFTASIAENRNIFSWHDKLEDLRTPDIGKGTTLSYSVLGWYRDPQHEPLSSAAAKVVERRDAANKLSGWLIDPPGWSIDANSAAPVELLERRSVFHGMVAHINYWNSNTYKGQILGYPGSPLVGGAMGKSKPSFKVGVGNNAEDALVSLVSSEYSGEQQKSSLAKEQPNLWKALEAVIYRQSETLVRSWNVAPRDMTVHQNWFATREAGKIWYIRPRTDHEAVFPADANQTLAQTAIQPTPEQLAKLKELNQAQDDVDTASRDLAALQQDLYARWWKLVNKSKQFGVRKLDPEEAECRELIKEVTALRAKLNGLINRLQPLPAELKSKLPEELELKYDAAPRFWTPADPVIVVKNCGSPGKHQFPRQHPCRLPEEIITTAKVVVQNEAPITLNSATGVADIATAAQKHLPNCPEILNGLLNEASIVEQAIRSLVEQTLPRQPFPDAGQWSQWAERLSQDVTWSGDTGSMPFDQITFEPQASNILPHRLVDLWKEQPWSPLFIDWQITWFPTAQFSTAENPFGPVWSFDEADFVPADRRSIPQQGYTVRGRSLLSPIDDRLFKEPVDTLRKLLQSRTNGASQQDTTYPPAVIEVLKRYEVVWSETLSELPRGGLMGQALTGFHQALLRRDVTLPRMTPDPDRPWLRSENTQTFERLKSVEHDVKTLLDVPDDGGVTGERLAPPAPLSQTTSAVPFSLIRAGAMRIDELWLVDDFGQFADLLGLTAARSQSSGQVFHPRMRWHDDRTVVAMPPRVLQPARLNFRFTAATESSNETTNSEPALSSICGWIFYNPLDHALVLCDRKGELMGHLVIIKNEGGLRIKWEAGAGGVAIGNVLNPSLKAFAESLIETTPASKPRLLELLNVIDNALERIRPGSARPDTILVGRPLALVSASVGLELFGKAWSDPHAAPVERPVSGDQKLDALRVRVNLGYAHSVEDGLIGYFKDGAYNRIVVPQLSEKVKASDYIGDPKVHGLRAGFGATERLTLLMDPWGSVQAACGLVPAKTITLAHPELNKIVAQMEASFRVGPVLLAGGKLALPTPAGNKGNWNFSGPLTDQKAAAVVTVDGKYFGDEPVVAAEGRLLLLNEE
ncbi:MAG TPA: hypothetical protein VKB02_10790 [Pyrinomonadaceae bacterium]|nr:hypothetical protein [Pyrinomonadaceae bacterium]